MKESLNNGIQTNQSDLNLENKGRIDVPPDMNTEIFLN
jgi:hypothetical protein